MLMTTSRRRARRGAVIVEFALVVPFLSLIVFGVIDFSRAYGQMNALDSALREGARYGSRWVSFTVGDYSTAVKDRVQQYAVVYGFNGFIRDSIKVSVSPAPPAVQYITVTANAHPIPLPILTNFLGVPALTLTRSVSFRWECAGLVAGQCRP